MSDDELKKVDMDIRSMAAKVGQLEAESRQHGEAIVELRRVVAQAKDTLMGKMDEGFNRLDTKTRMPMLPVITMLLVAGGFLLTIMTLVTNSINSNVIRNTQKLDQHDDGHPEFVLSLQKQSIKHLVELINIVDTQHAAEHVEQEQDIQQLRDVNQRVEERLDQYLKDIAVMQTKFGRVVGRTSEGFHQKDANQVIPPLRRRIEALERQQLGQ